MTAHPMAASVCHLALGQVGHPRIKPVDEQHPDLRWWRNSSDHYSAGTAAGPRQLEDPDTQEAFPRSQNSAVRRSPVHRASRTKCCKTAQQHRYLAPGQSLETTACTVILRRRPVSADNLIGLACLQPRHHTEISQCQQEVAGRLQ
jgi:hypothetical protein